MAARRIIVCLDVDGGRVVKGVKFQGLRDMGDPAELAARCERDGADEVVFLDVSASRAGRETIWQTVERTARVLSIPLTLGGGIRTVDDVDRALRSGADKVSLNSSIVADPELLTRAAARFGAQCVVSSIDALRAPALRQGDANLVEGVHRVFTHGGSRPTELEAVSWAVRCAELGAGEILLTSIDRDGARSGYDLELTAAVASAVDVPVIASGGAGNAEHVLAALTTGKADAALLAGVIHEGILTPAAIKDELAAHGVAVRRE